MNNLSRSLSLHLEPLLRATWSWRSQGWTKPALLAAEHSLNGCSVLSPLCPCSTTDTTRPPRPQKSLRPSANTSQLHNWQIEPNLQSSTELHQQSRSRTPRRHRSSQSSGTLMGIMTQNWQLGVTMETTTAGSRAGRDGHRGMKATGRVKDQWTEGQKALPHSFCSVLGSISTWEVLSLVLPLLPVFMPGIGIVSQSKVVISSSVFLDKTINLTKLLLPDKKVATNTFPLFFNFSKEKQRIGWEKRTC